MKAQQNLQTINQFETLIISSPNCNDTIVMGLDNKLHFCIYRDMNKSVAITKSKTLPYSTLLTREIEFKGKLYIITDSEDEIKPTLVCIEEDGLSLKISHVKRKTETQDKNLLNR